MTPYMRTLMDPADADLFASVAAFVEGSPDVELSSGRVVSCHMVARATAKRFGLPCVDGVFGGIVEHSWLVLPDYIIDVYPVGALHPQLLHTKYLTTPWGALFVGEPLRTVETPDFLADCSEYMEAVGCETKQEKRSR